MAIKKKIIKEKEGRLSGFYKDSMVEFLVREVLSKNTSLTKTQIQRIFSHGYQAMRQKEGQKIVDNALQAVRVYFRANEIPEPPSKITMKRFTGKTPKGKDL